MPHSTMMGTNGCTEHVTRKEFCLTHVGIDPPPSSSHLPPLIFHGSHYIVGEKLESLLKRGIEKENGEAKPTNQPTKPISIAHAKRVCLR